MKTHEFINNEFKEIVFSELDNLSVDKNLIFTKEKIMNFNLGEDFGNLEELTKYFEENHFLSNLNLSKSILAYLIKIDELEYSQIDFQNLSILIKRYPENKLIPFIWAFHQIILFKEDEFFESEISDFLDLIFNKYEYLLKLDDFFEETGMKYEILHHERLRNSCKILLPIFKKFELKYPENLYFKRLTGILFYYNKNYSSSLELLNSIVTILKSKDILIDELDYLEVIEFMALNYDKLGEDAKVEECINFILTHLPVGVFEDKKEEITSWNIDSFFLRMRLNIKKNLKEAVLADYKQIKDDLIWWEWETDYPDVMKYVETNFPL